LYAVRHLVPYVCFETLTETKWSKWKEIAPSATALFLLTASVHARQEVRWGRCAHMRIWAIDIQSLNFEVAL
jgi:hypothetical protein